MSSCSVLMLLLWEVMSGAPSLKGEWPCIKTPLDTDRCQVQSKRGKARVKGTFTLEMP